MSWQSFPVIKCIHCDHEFQLDVYYDYEPGESFGCPECEKDIYIHSMDTIIEADLRAEPVKD